MENNIITGVAGFIGYSVSIKLLNDGYQVIGIDNVNSYYNPILKRDRLKNLAQFSNFTFVEADICNKERLDSVFSEHKPTRVIHLAAQAGVRHSIDNPYAYIDTNIVGFMNILEACRNYPVEHLIYASSSSVYGGNIKTPFSTSDNVDHPISLYAATKKSNELMAHTYSHLYNIPTTGVRFFTVYGPWGRPDMAYYKFTKNIIEGVPIDVYNHGKMERDFTYIDDIVDGIISLIDKPPVPNPSWNEKQDGISSSYAPYKIYNIGKGSPVSIEKFISILEDKIGKKAVKNYTDMQQGDVCRTYADISDLVTDVGFRPKTDLEDGLENFVNWYKEYHIKN